MGRRAPAHRLACGEARWEGFSVGVEGRSKTRVEDDAAGPDHGLMRPAGPGPRAAGAAQNGKSSLSSPSTGAAPPAPFVFGPKLT
jgi:hypothetical protein